MEGGLPCDVKCVVVGAVHVLVNLVHELLLSNMLVEGGMKRLVLEGSVVGGAGETLLRGL